MDEVWRGVPVTDEALTQCIKTLRRQLGDDAAGRASSRRCPSTAIASSRRSSRPAKALSQARAAVERRFFDPQVPAARSRRHDRRRPRGPARRPVLRLRRRLAAAAARHGRDLGAAGAGLPDHPRRPARRRRRRLRHCRRRLRQAARTGIGPCSAAGLAASWSARSSSCSALDAFNLLFGDAPAGSPAPAKGCCSGWRSASAPGWRAGARARTGCGAAWRSPLLTGGIAGALVAAARRASARRQPRPAGAPLPGFAASARPSRRDVRRARASASPARWSPARSKAALFAAGLVGAMLVAGRDLES